MLTWIFPILTGKARLGAKVTESRPLELDVTVASHENEISLRASVPTPWSPIGMIEDECYSQSKLRPIARSLNVITATPGVPGDGFPISDRVPSGKCSECTANLSTV